MGRVFYYMFLRPVALLPLPILYGIHPLVHFLVYRVLRYRRYVVRKNLVRSLPHRSKDDIRRIEKLFYRHFCDLLIESVKGFTLTKKELSKRLVCKNPEILEDLYREGRSVLLVGGHYANWEWMIVGQNLLFQHQAVGVGMPIRSGFWNEKINALRERYGMRVINSGNLKERFDEYSNERIAVLLLADQTPGDIRKSFWTPFLGQLSPVLYGPEYLAMVYDMPVVYYSMEKKGRGYYEVVLKELTRKPRETSYGEITHAWLSALEADINRTPELWLWSHNRWKHPVPGDVDELMRQNVERFNKLRQPHS